MPQYTHFNHNFNPEILSSFTSNELCSVNLYYILTYLHTYILTYLHTYILTYLHTYILTYFVKQGTLSQFALWWLSEWLTDCLTDTQCSARDAIASKNQSRHKFTSHCFKLPKFHATARQQHRVGVSNTSQELRAPSAATTTTAQRALTWQINTILPVLGQNNIIIGLKSHMN